MAKRISSATTDFLADGGSWREAFTNGILEFYTGAQPASADAAPTGTLLCVLTEGGLAHTQETVATTTISLSGTAGSVDSVTIGGMKLITAAVNFTTDLATTATNLAAAINSRRFVHNFRATSLAGIVTISAPKNSGSTYNGMGVVCTVTTLTAQINGVLSTTLGGSGAVAGVDAVNGLKFGNAASGTLQKDSGVWRGTALSTNQAGWWRLKGHGAADDNSNDSTTKKYFRYDGNCGTIGADLTLSNSTFTVGADQTQSLFSLTVTTSQD